ncbi:MAG TPA: substrate-binding domain-containing protein [Chloroflexota bacterium]|nr:substrate-binding domain-containing protein [Chloroflexota bacterium]
MSYEHVLLTRRSLFRGGLALGLGLASIPLLAACGGSTPAAPTAPPASAPTTAPAPTATAATSAAQPTQAPAAAAPTQAAANPNAPLTKDQIVAALKDEGNKVSIKSWGFGGLTDSFPQHFKDWTQKTYGVGLDLAWDPNDTLFQQYEQAKKPIGDAYDIVDKEEDSYPLRKELNWIEKINQPRYANVLTNWSGVEPAYILDDGVGVIYQGFEWLGGCVRKDKVNPDDIKDWTDLANPKYKGLLVMYDVSKDTRGRLIFTGVLSSLLKQGIVKGDLWSEDSWLAGLKWFKTNIEPNVQKYVDIAEMQTMMQSGQAGIALTWGSYVREIQGSDWNLRDKVVVPIYPASGMASDREVITVAKGAKHPVGARVLANWMLDKDFLMAGWYKDAPDGKDQNNWNITQGQFLTAYAGGVNPKDRALLPDWAKAYYPPDPAKYAILVNFPWFSLHQDWTKDKYPTL